MQYVVFDCYNEFQDLILGLSVETTMPVNGKNSEVKFSVVSNESSLLFFFFFLTE